MPFWLHPAVGNGLASFRLHHTIRNVLAPFRLHHPVGNGLASFQLDPTVGNGLAPFRLDHTIRNVLVPFRLIRNGTSPFPTNFTFSPCRFVMNHIVGNDLAPFRLHHPVWNGLAPFRHVSPRREWPCAVPFISHRRERPCAVPSIAEWGKPIPYQPLLPFHPSRNGTSPFPTNLSCRSTHCGMGLAHPLLIYSLNFFATLAMVETICT